MTPFSCGAKRRKIEIFFKLMLEFSLFFQVRERSQVTALSSSQQEQLLRAVEQSDTFHRRMTAHSILYNLHFFLVDCKRVIVNKRATKAREAAGSRLLTAVTFYQQKLKM